MLYMGLLSGRTSAR